MQILILIVFLTTVFLNSVKRNLTVIALYATQSLAVAALLLVSFFEHRSGLLLLVIFLTLAVKSIAAPLFFIKLVKKHQLIFSMKTYLNMPFTLLSIAILTVVAHSDIFSSLTAIMAGNKNMIALSIAVMLISFFLIINRKSVISQIMGILSLENGIVCFGIFSGLEQAPGLQIGIIFNIFIWISIATMFASVLYSQFGTHDTTEMKLLKY